jgi:gamma-glutamylcyclotransferase (GGCT)/AIG2-like uncharacterized protein YtfP
MPNVLDEIDISKIKGIDKPVLPLWVYGTLRTGRRFHYYLVDCSAKVGEYQMDGTLMQMVSGDVFVRKDGSERKTTGELYRVSLAGLWRIFHLENQSGSFPKAYDLSVSKIFESATGNMGVALWFRRREEEALPIQDYNKHKTLLEELVEHIEANPDMAQNDIDSFLREGLEKPVHGM